MNKLLADELLAVLDKDTLGVSVNAYTKNVGSVKESRDELNAEN